MTTVIALFANMLFSALTIFLICYTCKKSPELKGFRKTLIIAIVLVSLTILGSAFALANLVIGRGGWFFPIADSFWNFL